MKRIQIFGGPSVGKTHYGVQLFIRLRNAKPPMPRFHKLPEDFLQWEEALESLSDGKTASRTSGGNITNFKWCLNINDQIVELEYPEYPGELMDRVLTTRELPFEWEETLSNSDAWLVFIRPNMISEPDDIFSRPPGSNGLTDSPQAKPRISYSNNIAKLPEDIKWVERFQIFLTLLKRNPFQSIDLPKVAIILSCWDELPVKEQKKNPKLLLNERLPLFFQFLESNWSKDSWAVFGLSSLGMTIEEEKNSKIFIDKGPENQGYCICEDGKHNSNLLLPLLFITNLAVQ